MKKTSFVTLAFFLVLSACSGADKEATYPENNIKEQRAQGRGSLTDEGGLVLFGGKEKQEGGTNIGVNGFLWRATLDTLSFMPIASADPFGGVIITDWYEDPKTPGERFKINAFILDRNLRSDAVKIKVFKQTKHVKDGWKDAEVSSRMPRDIEDTILTRARQLRVEQIGAK